MMMRMEIAITQAVGLRRVAADLDRVWAGHWRAVIGRPPKISLGVCSPPLSCALWLQSWP